MCSLRSSRGLTGGEDGRSFKVPEALQPGFRLVQDKVFGVAITGKILTYYLVFAVVAVAFLVLLRVVNSPFGRVLQAIRENPFRAEALGYRTVFHRTLANCISALGATLAGALFALWLRYVGPDTALSFSIQVDVLVMVVVGGMGSLYGAIIGAALFVFAESYLQDVMAALSQAAANASVPLLAGIVPSRPLAAVAWTRLRACGLFRAERDRRRAQGRRGEGELTFAGSGSKSIRTAGQLRSRPVLRRETRPSHKRAAREHCPPPDRSRPAARLRRRAAPRAVADTLAHGRARSSMASR